MALTPLDDALAELLAAVPVLHPRAVPIGEALGCVTSMPVVAEEAVPPFASSAMDGFAVRSADVAGAGDGRPVRLDVVLVLPAGKAAPEGFALAAGQAVRIMTGAPVPPGADAVVPVERTRRVGESASDSPTSPSPSASRLAESASDSARLLLGRGESAGDSPTRLRVRGESAGESPPRVPVEVGSGGAVDILHAARPGDHVRPAGQDARPGDVAIAPGTALTPAHLGVLASLGLRRVPVHPRPRVGVLSTGDELVDLPPPLPPGAIRDSNRPALLALVARAGFEPVDLGHVPDDPEAIRDALLAAVERCDAVLTSGGVSVGDFDHVKVVLDDVTGGGMRWLQVAIKPAKPFAYGVVPPASPQLPGTPIIGLPGNPASSLVSFEVLARPALRKLAGHHEPRRPTITATVVDGDLRRSSDGKLHLVRVEVRWSQQRRRFEARSAGAQASNLLAASAAADGLALVPDGPGVAEGAEVEVLHLTYP